VRPKCGPLTAAVVAATAAAMENEKRNYDDPDAAIVKKIAETVHGFPPFRAVSRPSVSRRLLPSRYHNMPKGGECAGWRGEFFYFLSINEVLF